MASLGLLTSAALRCCARLQLSEEHSGWSIVMFDLMDHPCIKQLI